MAIDYTSKLAIENFKNNSTLNNIISTPFLNRFGCSLNFKDNTSLDIQVLSVEIPEYGVELEEVLLNGTKRFYGKNKTFSDVSITFLETSELKIKKYFTNWIDKIMNVNSDGVVVRGYMENFTASSNMLIFPLNTMNIGTTADQFHEVFPYSISSYTYNYEEAGQLIKTTVKFKYLQHKVITIPSS